MKRLLAITLAVLLLLTVGCAKGEPEKPADETQPTAEETLPAVTEEAPQEDATEPPAEETTEAETEPPAEETPPEEPAPVPPENATEPPADEPATEAPQAAEGVPEGLIGSWTYFFFTYEFRADGTGVYHCAGDDLYFTYTAKDGVLNILYDGEEVPMPLDYRIEGNTLIVLDSMGTEIPYTKQ